MKTTLTGNIRYRVQPLNDSYHLVLQVESGAERYTSLPIRRVDVSWRDAQVEDLTTIDLVKQQSNLLANLTHDG